MKTENQQILVKYLRSIITVRGKGGRIIEISVMHPVPTMAADIANALSDTYVEKTLIWRQSTADDTTNFIRSQLEFYWKRLSESEDALAKAQEKSPLGYLSEEADGLVSETARLKTEIFEAGKARKVPLAPVNSIAEVMESEQFKERGFFVNVEHPKAGKLTYPGALHKLSETPWAIRRPAPLLGQHNEDIYCNRLGYTKRELAKMYESGTI